MTGAFEIKHVPACYRMVDTCSAEFTASTPYFYSTFGEEDEAEEFIKENASGKPVVMVFGSVRSVSVRIIRVRFSPLFLRMKVVKESRLCCHRK